MAALALAVDTLVEPEHPEHVVVDLARDEPAGAVFEVGQLLLDLGVEGRARSSRMSIAIPEESTRVSGQIPADQVGIIR